MQSGDVVEVPEPRPWQASPGAASSGQRSAPTALKSSAKPAAASPATPGANASAATPLKITVKSAPPLPDLEIKKESKFIYADLDAFEKT